MKAFVLAFAILASAPANADPVLRFPNRYEAALRSIKIPRFAYFHCDYTSRACMRGWAFGGSFVGEILGEDRTTVLAHVQCSDISGTSVCVNYDTGVINFTGPPASRQTFLDDNPSNHTLGPPP
jgi:hypothetical protein